jgi:hypothetical protein
MNTRTPTTGRKEDHPFAKLILHISYKGRGINVQSPYMSFMAGGYMLVRYMSWKASRTLSSLLLLLGGG